MFIPRVVHVSKVVSVRPFIQATINSISFTRYSSHRLRFQWSRNLFILPSHLCFYDASPLL